MRRWSIQWNRNLFWELKSDIPKKLFSYLDDFISSYMLVINSCIWQITIVTLSISEIKISKQFFPTPTNSKLGCYEKVWEQNLFLNNLPANIVSIGDSKHNQVPGCLGWMFFQT